MMYKFLDKKIGSWVIAKSKEELNVDKMLLKNNANQALKNSKQRESVFRA